MIGRQTSRSPVEKKSATWQPRWSYFTPTKAYKLMSTISNWPDVVLREVGFKREIVLRYRNGLVIRGPDWFFGVDVFYNQPYRFLQVKDKEVVDIGAFVGDTALYFATKGARMVYAFEPFSRYAQIARDNMKANSINNVRIFQRGVGNQSHSEVSYGIESTTVECVSLREIVESLHIKQGAVMKLDCEGAEYDILLSGRPPLDIFDEIIMEYHDGSVLLEDGLRLAGFRTRVTKKYGERVGILYATRV